MMDISCDACGKKYRVDETKMKGEMARVKCKACKNLMVVTKPRPEVITEPPQTPDIFEPSEPAFIPEPVAPEPKPVPRSVVERTAFAAPEKPAQYVPGREGGGRLQHLLSPQRRRRENPR